MMGRLRLRLAVPLLLGLLPLGVTGIQPGNLPAQNASDNPAPSTTETDYADYAWPTDAGRIGTSTFGEYRRTHFHGGIDISTGNRTGYKVFAARDGYVSRIRVSPSGYGKMLHVRHADGYFSTYSHLSRFSVAIDARVAQEQHRTETYTVDITCAPGDFPVLKGDIIAYTGETGIGSPHLHFEIRDSRMNPVNPLLCQEFFVPDDLPPIIKKVAVSALAEESAVDGAAGTRTYTVQPIAPNTYRIRQTIRMSGKAGFAVNTIDRTRLTHFKRGAYAHRLYIDDEFFYAVQLDRVPGPEAHLIGLYYDWDLRDQGHGRFERLYVNTPGSLLISAPRSPEAGVISTESLTPGKHAFRIESTDFNGNTAEVSGTIFLSDPPRFDLLPTASHLQLIPRDSSIERILVSWKKHGYSRWITKTMSVTETTRVDTLAIDLPRGADVLKVVAQDTLGTSSHPTFHFVTQPKGPAGSITIASEVRQSFVALRIKATNAISDGPQVLVYEGERKSEVKMTPVDIDEYTGWFYPDENHAGTRRIVATAGINGHSATALSEFDLYPIAPGKSGRFVLDGGTLILEHDSASVFKTVLMQVVKQNDELPAYLLVPENTVLRGGIRVSIKVNPQVRHQGLFFNGLRRMELLNDGVESLSGSLTGTITQTLGEVLVASDDTPPFISRFSIAGSGSSRPTVTFRYGDNLSGVEYKELKMYLDGAAVIPEVDGERRRVVYQVREPLHRGSHLLTIRIKDMMGNAQTLERSFSVH
jgi:murein DD-endopeptidase MepM/ murein hydrolase activator NlpD